MDLLQSDLGVVAALVLGIVGTGLAIVLDYAPDRRRRRSAADTQRLH